MGTGTPTPRLQGSIEASILRLRRNAGDSFEAFVNDFERYTNDVALAITEADQGSILNAQGSAQRCRKLLMLFKDALSK